MTKEELYNVLQLSNLEISEDEIDNVLKDMDNIINFANEINSANFEEVEFNGLNNLENVFRDDEVINSCSQKEILKNTKSEEDGFFYVKNVSK